MKDINLTIEKGEFVFVVGSSGAGKSTFLKLMMREEVPSSGTIVVDDTDLTKIKKRDIPKFRRRLGIVFQDFSKYPPHRTSLFSVHPYRQCSQKKLPYV